VRSFKDNEGRPWEIRITVDAIKRVRALLDVDLLGVLEGKLVDRLSTDPVLLCDVVYVVCKPQADAKGISDEDFGRAMAGDAIDAATKALLDELVDFSPSRRDRQNLRRVLDKTWTAMERARDVVEAKIERFDADEVLRRALATSGGSSGAALESPASTPAS
jgi:hypothetical protein